MWLAVAVLAVAQAMSLSPDEDPEPRGKLDGEWELFSASEGRYDLTPEDVVKEEVRCVIRGKSFVLKEHRKEQKMTFTVNWSASPAEIDFVLPDGKGGNHGIVSLENGRLTVCVNCKWYACTKAERPKAFAPLDAANRGLDGLLRMTFRRKVKR